MGFPDGTVDEKSTCNAGDTGDGGSIPGVGDLLEEERATYSSILACKVPWTEEPGGLQYKGSQRGGHD